MSDVPYLFPTHTVCLTIEKTLARKNVKKRKKDEQGYAKGKLIIIDNDNDSSKNLMSNTSTMAE